MDEAHGTETHVTPGAAITERTIAEATRSSPARVAELLAEDQQRGIVVRAGGGWRLSRRAERAYGAALRSLGDGPLRTRRSSRLES